MLNETDPTKDAARSPQARPVHDARRFDLLGVSIDNVTLDTAIDVILGWAHAGLPRLVCFVNAACLNIASHDDGYQDILRSSDLVLADGIGVRLGAKLRGVDVVDNVNGTDLFPLLCERAAASGDGLFLLGSAEGVAAAAADVMVERYPGLRIAGTHHGYFSAAEEQDVLDAINASGASVLLVALGVPEQEKWLARVAPRLEVPVRVGVGALFDLTSGRVPRAPRPVRAMHLEWAWRLAMEPRRMWRRYVLGNPVFLARAVRDARRRAASGEHDETDDHRGDPVHRPTITVLVAAYNAAATVGATLSSVLTQDYPGVDVVVVDDGSTDGTSAVVQGYVDAGHPVTLLTEPNHGCAGARNIALQHATGELVAVLDADDQLLPGYFDAAVDALAGAGERTWATVDAYLLTPGGFDPRRTVLRFGAPAPERQQRAILEANFVSIFSVLPRAMVEEVGGFRTELPTCEDWDLWARAIMAGWRAVVVRRPLALYRWTAGSMSSDGSRMATGERMVLENVRDAFGDRLDAADRAYLDERIAAGSLMTLRRRADDALRAGDIATARRGYAQAARLAPADRPSAVKARTLGNPIGNRLWRRRLAAADAATGRARAGR